MSFMRQKNVVIYLSVACLAMLPLWVRVHSSAQLKYLTWANICEVGLIWLCLFCTVCFTASLSKEKNFLQWLGYLLAALLTIFFLPDTLIYIKSLILPSFSLRSHIESAPLVVKILLLLAFLIVCIFLCFRRVYFGKWMEELFVILSPLGLILIINITWLQLHSDVIIFRNEHVVINNSKRVVWLIFDELDSDILNSNLKNMPNFSWLNAHSLNASYAVPPASQTLASIPSLLSGRRFSDIDYIESTLLNHSFERAQTIFNCECSILIIVTKRNSC